MSKDYFSFRSRGRSHINIWQRAASTVVVVEIRCLHSLLKFKSLGLGLRIRVIVIAGPSWLKSFSVNIYYSIDYGIIVELCTISTNV